MICYIFNIIDLFVCYPFKSCIYHSEKSISNCVKKQCINDNDSINNKDDNECINVTIGRESIVSSMLEDKNTVKVVRDSGVQSTSIETGKASPQKLKIKNKKNTDKDYDEITGDDLTFTHSVNSDSDDDYILPDQFIYSNEK